MIRNIFIACIPVLFFLPALAYAENINSFDSQIVISKDSSFNVTETIEYAFTEPRHGIFRYIPLIHQEPSEHLLKERVIEVELESVEIDGKDVSYEESKDRKQFNLKIGDPNALIEGVHTYTISYRVRGGLSYPKNQGAEFYYNVTGNGWEVPMQSVSARIVSPDNLFLNNRSCYRDIGESSGSCSQSTQKDGSVVFRTTELMPGEGVTIAQALDSRNVDRILLEQFKILWVLIPISMITFFVLGVGIYRFKTRFKTGRTIIAQYEPYEGIRPMYTGLLMDGNLDARDITACIVYLAEQGYIKIKKTEKKVLFLFEVDDYEMELLKKIDDAVGAFDRRIIEILFGVSSEIGTVISLQELKQNQDAQRENFRELAELKQMLSRDLKETEVFEFLSTTRITLSIIGVIVLSCLLIFIPFLGEIFHVTGFIVCIIAIILIGTLYRRRTSRGYEILDYLKGFKLFLEMTEKERYDFHNAPEKSPEQFMEYLPYAIAFGVEEKWAKVFEGITIPNPGWYDGGSVSSFSATNLTTSLGAFSTAFAASSGAPPSSGGGHSGGGSGGGGGGSW